VIVFPAICPKCASDSGKRMIPESPEVETFRCARCQNQWSEPAPPSALRRAEADRRGLRRLWLAFTQGFNTTFKQSSSLFTNIA
jgi:hypothetical protein